MRKRKLKRMALATLSLAACLTLLGTFAEIEPAHARGGGLGGHALGANRGLSAPPPFLDSIPSMPAPTFNPSIPYTMPESPETPVSPTSPGSVFGTGPSTGFN